MNKEERLIRLFKNLSKLAYDLSKVDSANKDSYLKESVAYDTVVFCFQDPAFLEEMEKLFN